MPNKSLQPTAQLLRGFASAEFGRCHGRFVPATTGRRMRSAACAARSAAQPRGSSRLQAEKPAALLPFAAYPPPR